MRDSQCLELPSRDRLLSLVGMAVHPCDHPPNYIVQKGNRSWGCWINLRQCPLEAKWEPDPNFYS